jgi:hypothetical protein
MEGILDALILALISFPALYLLVLRPLQLHLDRVRQSEQELAGSRASLYNIVEYSTDGIIVLDQNKRVRFYNRTAAIMLDWGKNKRTGERFDIDVKEGKTTMIDILRDGKVPGVASLKVLPTTWEREPSKLLILRDITTHQQVETALKESEERFRSLIMSATDAIVGMDENGLISVWNSAAERMFGYTAQETIGKELHSLIVPEMYREQAHRGLKEFYRTGKGKVLGKTVELTGLRKDGTQFPIELSVSCWRKGDQLHATGIIRDITARKHDEAVIKKSEKRYRLLSKELADANSLKELLLDIITHDLKNPAGVIHGMADIEVESNPENEVLRLIRDSSENLLNVVENATTLAQVATGEGIEMKPMDLGKIIREVVREFEPLLQEAGMEVKLELEEPLPVKANPIIAEVFKNYISNAIKYAAGGRRIDITGRKEEPWVLIGIRDYGAPIAPADRELIFKRGVSIKDKQQRGRGLGLAIVRRIAETHNGEAWVAPVEDQPEVGKVFYLKLPLVNQEQPAEVS